MADVYDVDERGNALGIYFTGQFAGPLFGPIFGGFLVERWGWQSVFWLLFVIGCLLLLLVFFTMEETYRDEKVWGKSAMIELEPDQKSENTVVEAKMVNPLASLALLRHPFIFICAIATGFAFGGMVIYWAFFLHIVSPFSLTKANSDLFFFNSLLLKICFQNFTQINIVSHLV